MSQGLTAVIADDEPVLREHLKQLLTQQWPELTIVAMAGDGDEAWRLIDLHRPDVVFLDIRMPGRNGLDVAESMQQAGLTQNTALVFLTAYDQYAVEAFEREALDYLLKPVEPVRLDRTRERILAHQEPAADTSLDVTQLRQLIEAVGRPPLRWLNVQRGQDIRVVDVADVLCFRAEDKYTTVVTAAGESLIRKSLRQLEEELDTQQFWRIHRSTLVQVAHIDRVEKTLTGRLKVHLKGGRTEEVSRRFADRFRQM
ncbi:hypothetical protein BGP77_10425 [Saccharospirillum sp. MSK14-1]|uniref:LytR/AlgR family response regulator transcription factor n=1 Tax=Saccharospirillum sp. MSK14-1 TaxID=1897632 RepID=UPI000D3BEAB4|nr:LytTR family DNA-binding domain-containing protein [Saccharospirillum sp. MSK14-1]PTY38593.1 hypothetical protein BGP77_10425 [Saccharospirillum sp. MSK14-1]